MPGPARGQTRQVAWITKGTDEIDSTVSVMPDYMDQQGGCENKIAWITERTDKMDPTVTDMPCNKFDWITNSS